MSSAVSRIPAASSAEALAHFEKLLAHETDCWDVNHAVSNNRKEGTYQTRLICPIGKSKLQP